jgi:hypothetical protein
VSRCGLRRTWLRLRPSKFSVWPASMRNAVGFKREPCRINPPLFGWNRNDTRERSFGVFPRQPEILRTNLFRRHCGSAFAHPGALSAIVEPTCKTARIISAGLMREAARRSSGNHSVHRRTADASRTQWQALPVLYSRLQRTERGSADRCCRDDPPGDSVHPNVAPLVPL